MRTAIATRYILGVLLALATLPVFAQDETFIVAAPEEPPTTTGWDATTLETIPALTLDGKVGDGGRAFEVCSHCHLPSAAGRPDGSVPQLAGQHTSVLIKQMSDIREGRRENPIMYPFARTLLDPQKLADVGAYIETLPIPRENGKGPGTHLELGETLYGRDCRECHLESGEGSAEQFVPVLAGQHYEYVLRQMRDIALGWRYNNHPAMAPEISSYTPDQLVALSDYVSRLEWPERQQQN